VLSDDFGQPLAIAGPGDVEDFVMVGNVNQRAWAARDADRVPAVGDQASGITTSADGLTWTTNRGSGYAVIASMTASGNQRDSSSTSTTTRKSIR